MPVDGAFTSLRAIVVDDEPRALRRTRRLVEAAEDVQLLAVADGGYEAERLIRSLDPDVVFLDIQRPGRDGFEVIESIGPERMPQVVLVTAHRRYAVRAFEINAVDYLLKPVDERSLGRAIRRCRRKLAEEASIALGRRLSAVLRDVAAVLGESSAALIDGSGRASSHRLLVKSGGGESNRSPSTESIGWNQPATTAESGSGIGRSSCGGP